MVSYYVYLLLDQGMPFYVGMGTGERYLAHERYTKGEIGLGYGLKADPNPYKTRKIRKILREGRTIGYRFWFCNSEDGAHHLEKLLIKHYGRKGIDIAGTLTNRHPGGVGGDTFSARTGASKAALRRRLSAIQVKIYEERGDEIKAKIKATKQRNGTWAKLTQGAHAKIAEQNRLRCIGQRVAIEQYSPDGELIATWSSLKEAADTLEIHQGPISNALDQIRKDGSPRLASGYIWRRQIN